MKLFIRTLFFISLAISLAQCQSPMNIQQTAGVFPELKARTLANRDITFPNDLTAKMTFIAMVFEERGAYQKAQFEANEWSPIYESKMKNKGVDFYEIPMMASGYSILRGWVDSGMRSGIVSSMHDNVACYYGNKKKYVKALDLPGMGVAHLFLLDDKGNILAQVSGPPTPEKEAELLKHVR